MKNKILIIVGPTASGKSDLAVQHAINNNGEIISSDSRQVYRGLDIGSGKITGSEMKNIKHYGLDIVNVMERFTSNDYLIYAKEKIEEILSKKKLPIIVGGTGLYVDALLYGIDDKPGPDYALREVLSSKTLEEIQNIIINKCKEANSEYYNNLNNSEKNNKERLIRKIETLSFEIANQNTVRQVDDKYNFEFIILNPDNKILEEKIIKRIDMRLLDNAMINEIKELINNHEDNKEEFVSWLTKLGLEYKYITKYIIGELTLQDARELLIKDTIKYSKRQKTWNKKYKDMTRFIY